VHNHGDGEELDAQIDEFEEDTGDGHHAAGRVVVPRLQYCTGVRTFSRDHLGAHTKHPMINATNMPSEKRVHMLNPATAARPANPTNATALYPDTWCEIAAIHHGSLCPATK